MHAHAAHSHEHNVVCGQCHPRYAQEVASPILHGAPADVESSCKNKACSPVLCLGIFREAFTHITV